jgi:hypothetical protein
MTKGTKVAHWDDGKIVVDMGQPATRGEQAALRLLRKLAPKNLLKEDHVYESAKPLSKTRRASFVRELRQLAASPPDKDDVKEIEKLMKLVDSGKDKRAKAMSLDSVIRDRFSRDLWSWLYEEEDTMNGEQLIEQALQDNGLLPADIVRNMIYGSQRGFCHTSEPIDTPTLNEDTGGDVAPAANPGGMEVELQPNEMALYVETPEEKAEFKELLHALDGAQVKYKVEDIPESGETVISWSADHSKAVESTLAGLGVGIMDDVDQPEATFDYHEDDEPLSAEALIDAAIEEKSSQYYDQRNPTAPKGPAVKGQRKDPCDEVWGVGPQQDYQRRQYDDNLHNPPKPPKDSHSSLQDLIMRGKAFTAERVTEGDDEFDKGRTAGLKKAASDAKSGKDVWAIHGKLKTGTDYELGFASGYRVGASDAAGPKGSIRVGSFGYLTVKGKNWTFQGAQGGKLKGSASSYRGPSAKEQMRNHLRNSRNIPTRDIEAAFKQVK